MLFAEVVAVSAEVAGTRSRTAKIAALAAVIRAAGPGAVRPVVAWLSGELLQGRLGAGWRTVARTVDGLAPAEEPALTVEDVTAALDELAGTSGAGSVARRDAVLTGMFGRATAAEQRFLIGLVTGELRQGALAGVVTDAVARAAEVPLETVRRAAMLSGSLPDTAAAALRGGAAELAGFGLEVLRGIAPMLASPAEDVASAMTDLGPDVSVEFKLDGARIQVHRIGDDVRVYTRTLRDITDAVPEIVAVARELPCRSVVLDGESLALTDAGRPRPFQETMSRFGSTESRETLLRPYFFDCLHLDGRDLLDEPLSVRLDALQEVAGALRIPALSRPTPDEAAAHYSAALAAGHEGVMVKALDSPYAAGRRGRSWQKVKQTHTVDLVVLGAEWGYGRRTGMLSNLHLGARDPDGGEPIMVGKTFKGLTDALLRWQTEEFPRHERERDQNTVYLRPEIVVEIELDGVQVSRRYPGGVALRFARVLRYRPDKTAAEADTIEAVRALLPG
ncbi:MULTISPECIES: ATP-dependent DNA ligase [Tsukamurella]|uniref:Probable DNA ligase n=2 Tax=Tsukamurella TaxID=2060 RepID=A0A5C5S5V4_9ACTN|nr:MULTISPECIES: ATP-dependent DNA ligase [Tsukamurella]NMD55801.1 ATP-dependent DNA ligase [Tsukamurella columbiensis]TWS30484.1 ATP-dependent DNA ligase [Tsukamurella conjunctivitidis]